MIKRGNRKRRRTRLISLILTLFMLISAVQTPVFAGSDVIYLPEDDIGEDILSGGAFYLSSSTAEIAENAGASYLFKVARGGEDLPDASVRLNILDT